MSRRTPQSTGRFHRAEVVRVHRLSPSFQRVTVAGEDLADFEHLGLDQWFRFFMQLPHQRGTEVPVVQGRRWWSQYLAIEEGRRPHCSNYTVAGYRAARRELDVDVVVHHDPDGQLAGGAAIWACGARPGDAVGLLDQGVLFDRGDATEIVVAADETGLPGVTGILRSLPASTTGRAFLEVPRAGDRRDLEAPAGVDVVWLARDADEGEPGEVPGTRALAALRTLRAVPPDAYGYVVGEASLATGGYRHLRSLGLGRRQVTFSGFWKHGSH